MDCCGTAALDVSVESAAALDDSCRERYGDVAPPRQRASL